MPPWGSDANADMVGAKNIHHGSNRWPSKAILIRVPFGSWLSLHRNLDNNKRASSNRSSSSRY